MSATIDRLNYALRQYHGGMANPLVSAYLGPVVDAMIAEALTERDQMLEQAAAWFIAEARNRDVTAASVRLMLGGGTSGLRGAAAAIREHITPCTCDPADRIHAYTCAKAVAARS